MVAPAGETPKPGRITEISRDEFDAVVQQWARDRRGEAQSGERLLLLALASASMLSPELRSEVDDVIHALCSPALMTSSFFQSSLGDFLFALLGDEALLCPCGIMVCSPELVKERPGLAEHIRASGKAIDLAKKLGRTYPCLFD